MFWWGGEGVGENLMLAHQGGEGGWGISCNICISKEVSINKIVTNYFNFPFIDFMQHTRIQWKGEKQVHIAINLLQDF